MAGEYVLSFEIRKLRQQVFYAIWSKSRA